MVSTWMTNLILILSAITAGHNFVFVPRIVGGNTTSDGQFPYMVSLRHSVSKEHLCGGVIIDAQWVLTAANCLKKQFLIGNDEYEVFVGSTVKYWGGHIRPVKKIFGNSFFKPTLRQYSNNLALLQLSKPLQFSHTVAPIALGTINDGDCTEVIAAGWGRTLPKNVTATRHLQYIILNTITTQQCQAIYKIVDHVVDGKTQICAYSGYGGSLCFGDYGGPLVNGKTGRLVGIFSNVENCRGHYPALFVRVSAYVGWIQHVTGISFDLF
ncbi:serine proteases 1/2-like [Asbolus verrucosus]|uniref:Serine proteases 1/2-like n=1 Tax=Asbolus verrucosus TaxID=1661398 RepID=A0A482V3V6_ASBVE|nr:serine proteases 1/2-like [Asbolus verrucosus]